ncbi:MAG: hypothetical protein DWQ04_23790 [Chloroflexi bacterium]|nr:MAG: hypothetical protein DWQ04_23790 [Chloroflexota bacterium]
MNQNLFDQYTRVLSQATSRREILRIMLSMAALSITSRFAGTKLAVLAGTPSSIYDDTCSEVNSHGMCQFGQEKDKRPGYEEEESDICTDSPDSFGRASFIVSCKEHDSCYQKCDKTKEYCDDLLRFRMQGECFRAYPGALNSLKRAACLSVAQIYHTVLSLAPKAERGWIKAQQNACQCCGELDLGELTIWCSTQPGEEPFPEVLEVYQNVTLSKPAEGSDHFYFYSELQYISGPITWDPPSALQTYVLEGETDGSNLSGWARCETPGLCSATYKLKFPIQNWPENAYPPWDGRFVQCIF